MVANLLEKGADVDYRNEVRIDMFVGPMSIKSFKILTFFWRTDKRLFFGQRGMDVMKLWQIC
jgi:hypothetical protein